MIRASVKIAEIMWQDNAIGVRIVKGTVSIGDIFDYLIINCDYLNWQREYCKDILSPNAKISLQVIKIIAYHKEFDWLGEGWTAKLYIDGRLNDNYVNNCLIISKLDDA